MVTLEEIVNELDTLNPNNLAKVARFIEYLKWQQGDAYAQASGQLWTFDLVEHFRRAMVTADHDPAGMEVQVGEAACGGDSRMALWQHPPVQGSSVIEYQVPIPDQVSNLRLVFATGIRDGSQLAEGNIVAFRVFVNDWKIWSVTQHARQWKTCEVVMPTLRGDVARVQLVTDGLGNHRWAWAVWAEPRLEGELTEK